MSTFQDKIQAKINKGFAKAAQRLGAPFVQYRPQGTGTVIVEDNIVQEIYFAFDEGADFKFNQPLDYNFSEYYALVDLTEIHIGDYFWDYNNRTFFVANIEPLKPAQLVLCNETVSVLRPSGSTTNGYGGNTNPTTILSGIPCSILPGTKGESNVAKTPGSTRAFWVNARIPDIAVIRPYDIMLDSQGRRFVIAENSLAQQGYFLTMSYQNS